MTTFKRTMSILHSEALTRNFLKDFSVGTSLKQCQYDEQLGQYSGNHSLAVMGQSTWKLRGRQILQWQKNFASGQNEYSYPLMGFLKYVSISYKLYVMDKLLEGNQLKGFKCSNYQKRLQTETQNCFQIVFISQKEKVF